MAMKKTIKNLQPARVFSDPIVEELLDNVPEELKQQVERRMMLAAKIIDSIEAKGWNNLRFAHEMDKHQSEISKWLSGTHNFTVETLVSIELKLGIQLIDCTNPYNKPKRRIRSSKPKPKSPASR